MQAFALGPDPTGATAAPGVWVAGNVAELMAPAGRLRFEEVSLGYPREWRSWTARRSPVRQVLPAR